MSSSYGKQLYFEALELHRAGMLDQAEDLYDAALSADPLDADALHMSAVLNAQRGRYSQAAMLLDKASSALSANVQFLLNKASVMRALGELAEATAAYQTATKINDKSFDAFFGLAETLFRSGRIKEAEQAVRRAIELHDGHAESLALLGQIYSKTDRLTLARDVYSRAISLSPNVAEWRNAIGAIFFQLSEYDQALSAFSEALTLQNGMAEAYSNIGLIFHAKRMFHEAVRAHEKAILADRTYAPGYSNLASALRELGRFEEAMRMYDRAIALDSQFADAVFNKGILLLQLGNFEEGLPLYEWRFKCPSVGLRLPKSSASIWGGSTSLLGKKLVVLAEQGLGDTLQFVRFVSLLPRFGARVALYSPKRLIPLLRSSFPDLELVSDSEPLPSCDFLCPLMSLPLALRVTLDTLPQSVPYLAVDAKRALAWRSRFSNKNFNIGIAWQGSLGSRVDSGRSFSLDFFKEISELPGVQLFSLQKLSSGETINFSEIGFEVQDFGRGLDSEGSFLDSAAIIKHLDLVITPDTSIAHLAGALGVRVYVALKFVADWRWLLKREDSPWYPSMKLFRQSELDNWGSVFSDIRRSVLALIRAERRGDVAP